ncbi:MAG: DedA family protein, partial [cyanobacterium endosymbiont of Rhopalodia fuxianensis]
SQFLLYNFGGAVIWASFMVTSSFFVVRIIPLHQLVESMVQSSIVALALLTAWIVISWWLDRRNQKSLTSGSKTITD